MSLVVFGLNHKTASLSLRNKVALTSEALTPHLRSLLSLSCLEEIIVLSTCNRTEWIVYTTLSDFAPFIHFIKEDRHLTPNDWQTSIYCHQGKDAFFHLAKVASGLDSMMIGEPQILGQVKAAFRLAKEMGTIGRELTHIFQKIFVIAKRIRTETALGQSTLSVAYAAVKLIQHFFEHRESIQVLLIGAGDTILRIARHLKDQGVERLIIANRTEKKAHHIADEIEGQVIHLTEIPEWLKRVDVVFSSTASHLPIIGKGMVQNALRAGKRRSLIMVDLAVPRDIEPEVGELEDVYLYTIDDLEQVVQDNIEKRQEAAKCAEDIIQQAVEEFWLHHTTEEEVNDIIRKYRARGESIQHQEVERAVFKIAKGCEAKTVLQELGVRLTNKLLHPMCSELKKAQMEGHSDILKCAKALLAIDKIEATIQRN